VPLEFCTEDPKRKLTIAMWPLPWLTVAVRVDSSEGLPDLARVWHGKG